MGLQADVYVDDRALSCLPDAIRRHVIRDGETNVLNTWQWALDVLHTPPYPERWVYRRMRDRMCACDPDGTLIVFRLWDPSRWRLPLTPEDHRCGEPW